MYTPACVSTMGMVGCVHCLATKALNCICYGKTAKWSASSYWVIPTQSAGQEVTYTYIKGVPWKPTSASIKKLLYVCVQVLSLMNVETSVPTIFILTKAYYCIGLFCIIPRWTNITVKWTASVLPAVCKLWLAIHIQLCSYVNILLKSHCAFDMLTRLDNRLVRKT